MKRIVPFVLLSTVMIGCTTNIDTLNAKIADEVRANANVDVNQSVNPTPTPQPTATPTPYTYRSQTPLPVPTVRTPPISTYTYDDGEFSIDIPSDWKRFKENGLQKDYFSGRAVFYRGSDDVWKKSLGIGRYPIWDYSLEYAITILKKDVSDSNAQAYFIDYKKFDGTIYGFRDTYPYKGQNPTEVYLLKAMSGYIYRIYLNYAEGEYDESEVIAFYNSLTIKSPPPLPTAAPTATPVPTAIPTPIPTPRPTPTPMPVILGPADVLGKVQLGMSTSDVRTVLGNPKSTEWVHDAASNKDYYYQGYGNVWLVFQEADRYPGTLICVREGLIRETSTPTTLCIGG